MKKKLTDFRRVKVPGKWLLALAGSMLFSLSAAYAQNLIRVTGSVHDPSGAPLAGAAVLEQGTLNGTTTNANGVFNLRVASSNAKLTISFLGRKTQTVGFTSGEELKVVLEDDAAMLDEIVAIGYGYVKKSDLTGAVASIKGEELEDRLVTSLEDALRGRIAGITIANVDGQPGETLNLRIRGTGSINASNAPLYVIDGMPVEDPGDFSTNDVESMEVLKDASATAIFGSRGANGVILITTKKGQKGKAKINVQYNGGFQTPVRLIDMAESWEYFQFMYRSHGFAAVEGSGVPKPNQNWTVYNDRYGNEWMFQPQSNKWAGWRDMIDNPNIINTDWQDIMLRSTGMHDFRATVSGGSDESKYSIMTSYKRQEGMVIMSGHENFNLRANFNQSVTRNLKLGLNVAATKSKNRGAITDDQDGTMMNMLKQSPNKAYNYAEGEDSEDEEDQQTNVSNNNPWYQAHKIRKFTNKDNLSGKINLDWQMMKSLRLNVTGNYTYNHVNRHNYSPSDVQQAKADKGRAEFIKNSTEKWINENMLYWTPAPICKKHTFDLMGGIILEEATSVNAKSTSVNFSYEPLLEWGMNFALTPVASTLDSEKSRMASFLGRAQYNYDRRYYLTATMRSDGSSRFGVNHRWGYFPSAAFAWRASEEYFLKNQRWINNLKLRTSVGLAGNPAIPVLQTQDVISSSNEPLMGSPDQLSPGFKVDRIKNPNLKWESSLQYDVAIDFGFLKSRINGTVEAYYKQTKDLLLREMTPSHTGYTLRWNNVGSVDNQGIEITLNAGVIRNKKFTWDLNYNMAFNRSKVISLGEADEVILAPSGSKASNYAILKVGRSLGSFYGYQTDGLFRSFEEIMALPDDRYDARGNLVYQYSAFSFLKPTGTKNDTNRDYIQPGFLRYRDMNGDGIINEDDRVILGCGQPKFTGGLQSMMAYKNFSLNVSMEFSYGRKIFNSTGLSTESGVGTGNINQTKHYMNNYWIPDLYYPEKHANEGELAWKGNENGTMPLPKFAYSDYMSQLTDRNLEDGSYLRISEINLGYDFDKKLLQKLSLSGFKVFVGVRNAWLFTKYTGYDPDVNTVSGALSDLVPGVDNGSYPRSRIWNFGFNVTF